MNKLGIIKLFFIIYCTIILILPAESYAQFGGFGGLINDLTEDLNDLTEDESAENQTKTSDEDADADADESDSDSSSETVSAVDLQEQLTIVKTQFVAAMSEMLVAQSLTLEALGKREEADLYGAESRALKEGDCNSNCMKRSITISQEASKASAGAMDQMTELTEASKEILFSAVLPYISGTEKGFTLPAAFNSWVTNASGSLAALRTNPMSAARNARLILEIPELVEVASSLPSLILQWTSTTLAFVSISNDAGVDTGDLEALARASF